MKLIYRDLDPISKVENLEFLNCFKNFPVFMGCTEKDFSEDEFMDMNFFISRQSGLLQINPLPSLETLYSYSHGSGTVGSIWTDHHKRLAEFIHQYEPKTVLEIGGGSGILSVNYHKLNSDVAWSIIEPNPTPVENCRANFITQFFDENFSVENPMDMVVHSHTLEHTFDPDLFIKTISELLPVGKKLIFSVPNLMTMFSRYYINALNFEHTVLLTEPYINFLLEKNNFKIINKQYYMEDHSIFFAAEKVEFIEITKFPTDIYSQNKLLLTNYIDYYKNLIDKFNSILKNTDKPVYIFGAHIFSQLLINRGLDTSNIISVLDNDKNKQGKRLYGSKLYVESPYVLKNLKNPIVVLKASNYGPEIKADILNNINESVIFLE